MSEITRRDALSRLAAAFAAAGVIDGLSADVAHAAVQEGRGAGAYVPKALSAHDFQTLERLTDLIIPIEDGRPGAVGAEVPAWIDTLLNVNADLKARYVAGLGWLDRMATARGARDFATASAAQQRELLDQIAFQKNRSPELNPGIDFFVLARRMTVDGFYTSRVGMRDIYPGNQGREQFTIPQDAMTYVVSRSPFR